MRVLVELLPRESLVIILSLSPPCQLFRLFQTMNDRYHVGLSVNEGNGIRDSGRVQLNGS